MSDLHPTLLSTAKNRERAPAKDAIAEFVDAAHRLENAIQKIVIGQPMVIRQAIVALFAGGHVLLEGVPGLGKTLLVRTLADVLALSFSRIQFTPDLMPADITGTTILQEDEEGRRVLSFRHGPVFAHLVLADEVNRATPKTQSALLEAMQEQTVSIGNETHELPVPFFVLATQNPLEMEGTYPLPEAQLDRFLFKILVPFPGSEVLRGIIEQTIQPPEAVGPVLDGRTLPSLMSIARMVPIAAPMVDYAISLVQATHPESSALDEVRQYVRAGASPRGLQALVLGSQVRSLLEGRYNVSIVDIQALAHPGLRHRILLNFEGEAEGISTDAVIDSVLDQVPVP
jgi:MoxR-like ATPase